MFLRDIQAKSGMVGNYAIIHIILYYHDKYPGVNSRPVISKMVALSCGCGDSPRHCRIVPLVSEDTVVVSVDWRLKSPPDSLITLSVNSAENVTPLDDVRVIGSMPRFCGTNLKNPSSDSLKKFPGVHCRMMVSLTLQVAVTVSSAHAARISGVTTTSLRAVKFG